MNRILVINPGSTSTKFAIYHDEENVFEKTLRHSGEELKDFPTVASQYEFRKETILNSLKENNVELRFDIIVGRGGLLHPLQSGAIEVNELMKSELLVAKWGEHACNLGALIADNLAKAFNCRAIVADPVVVDEMTDVAHISGHPTFPRKSIFHALNQKAIARKYSKDCGKAYEDLNLIIAHIGGGVSVAAHCKGKAIDANNALSYGAFSPERSGTMPSTELVKLCFSGKHTEHEIQRMLCGKGGLIAHLNSNDAREVEARIAQGDKHAELVYHAMAYNIAKEIGAMMAVLKGECDAILLTGGIAYSKPFTQYIIDMVGKLAPVKIYAGEDELGALAAYGISVMNGGSCDTYTEYKA
ncbi:MAG: butyrate kinase [Bacteroidales bacterium]|nr:butyrate kinase [Bacteroidales bacterium]